ncbi:hypothetical protein [Micromonospora pattaloongensis]|uniref:hypothetical protein n=1 Tax=Micromonospora pattaloongensis TaxID=405436 RepID=UPI001FE0BF88|nr:hypothetical protein [Micromonospora pattaloongensis]
MNVADDEQVAASLAGWIRELTFVDRAEDEVTALLVDAAVAWGTGQGWRVYRRAPSVVSLPPPYEHRRSSLDVACARAGGAPIVIEVDRSHRRRTVDKLVAESEAGRIAIWVRWGTGTFEPPAAPVRMVTCPVTSRRGLGGQGTLYSRLPASDRPAPQHTAVDISVDRQGDLFD